MTAKAAPAPVPMAERPAVPVEECVAALEGLFRRTGTRMAGLPVCNAALSVEAVGFRQWQGMLVGVLITPWTINLMVLQQPGGPPLRPLALDEQQLWRFPSGDYELLGGYDQEFGPWHGASLLSPPHELASQDDARAVASAVLGALFTFDGDASHRRAAAPTPGRSGPRSAGSSRRAFLTLGRAR